MQTNTDGQMDGEMERERLRFRERGRFCDEKASKSDKWIFEATWCHLMPFGIKKNVLIGAEIKNESLWEKMWNVSEKN